MTTKDYQTRSPLRIFLSYFKPHRRLFALDLSCAFLIACIDLAFPLVSRAAMYTWLPQRQFRVFFIVMAVVVAAYVLRSALYFVVAYWGHTFGIRVEADIRRDLYRHIQELGFDFYDRNRTGQLMSRLTSDLFELTELAHHGPEDLFISLVTIVGALAVMFTLRWELALVLLVLLPVLLTMALRRRRQMSAASRAAKVKTGTINAAIESGLSGVRTTKAFANEEAQQQRFDEANEVFKTAKRGFHKEMGRFNAVMEFCTGILPVAVIAVGGWLIMGEKMDYVDLITFSLYVTAFVSPIRKLANFAEMFSNGFAGLHRFIELMATEPSIQDAPDARPLEHVQGRVDVNDVSFAYGEKAEVLHSVTLHIPAGETVALVGPSGGGKTTLCQLLPRFYDVDSGSITVDGRDVRAVTQRSLRRAIGIVQQDVFLFADTIRENIRYGRPDATDEEIAQAEAALSEAAEKTATLADRLHKTREKAAAGFEKHILSTLARLGMPETVFRIALTPLAEPGRTGRDSVQFLFTANPRMTPQPVERIASGGELSRVMLALKALLAERMQLPTIIFDEIDTGVSGRIADAMGASLSASMQVVDITHLPQVASKGTAHFVVYKRGGRTDITRLGDEERVTEIAKMLSGSEITDAAVAQARILLGK